MYPNTHPDKKKKKKIFCSHYSFSFQGFGIESSLPLSLLHYLLIHTRRWYSSMSAAASPRDRPSAGGGGRKALWRSSRGFLSKLYGSFTLKNKPLLSHTTTKPRRWRKKKKQQWKSSKHLHIYVFCTKCVFFCSGCCKGLICSWLNNAE